MFKLFRSNPEKALEREYYELLELALKAQRNGDIRQYSELSREADKVLRRWDELKEVSATTVAGDR